MKKILTALLLCSAIVVSASKPWRFGIEGGLDISEFKSDKSLVSDDNRLGWFVGPKLKVALPLLGFGVDVAALYRHNELKYLDTNLSADNTYELTAHMLAVPLNIRYDFHLLKFIGLYIATGPQLNWTINEDRNTSKALIDKKSYYFDWNAGFGLDLLGHIQLGANYNIPIGDIGHVKDTKLKGHTWNIRVACFF